MPAVTRSRPGLAIASRQNAPACAMLMQRGRPGRRCGRLRTLRDAGDDVRPGARKRGPGLRARCAVTTLWRWPGRSTARQVDCVKRAAAMISALGEAPLRRALSDNATPHPAANPRPYSDRPPRPSLLGLSVRVVPVCISMIMFNVKRSLVAPVGRSFLALWVVTSIPSFRPEVASGRRWSSSVLSFLSRAGVFFRPGASPLLGLPHVCYLTLFCCVLTELLPGFP